MELNDVMNDLKWSEMAEVEEVIGATMEEWDDFSKAKLMFGLQFVMAKRNKPELTVEEAEQMSINALTALAMPPAPAPKAKQS